ncbi:MAG: alpha-glucosidase, partial [Halanaerobium sp.]
MDNSQALLQGKSRDDSSDYHKLQGVLNYEVKDNKVLFDFEYASIAIELLRADIFRVVMAHSNQPLNYKTTEAVVEHNLSLDNFEVEEKKEKIVIETEELQLKI